MEVTNTEVGNTTVTFSETARNLGAIVESAMGMRAHVSSLCRSGYMNIRIIGCIRHMLPHHVAEQLTHAFVTSRLDSCNSLLFGLADVLINKLQRLQNTAARMVTRTKKSDHITPVLHQLHWLPVQQRINVFKILLLTYRALHGLAPAYFEELLELYSPVRTLRSSADKWQLAVPGTRSPRYGDRAFSACASRVWNSIPLDIRNCGTLSTFKRRLKTYLFSNFLV